MQKFTEGEEPLSERSNIVVIADEAHRGQYGLAERIDTGGQIKKGIARIIRDNLPNATYLGFTGTPISMQDRNTREVFGDYIDVYDMTQAVEDGATRPVYYESRVMNLHLDNEVLARIDAEYDMLAQRTEEVVLEKSKKQLSQMEALLGHDITIESLALDIIEHYEQYRSYLLTGKAMIVAYSRGIAIKLYHKILALRPTWKEKVAVVMTSDNNDPEEWKDIIGNKKYRDDISNKFKDNENILKIAIVVDMWLTGFDVPSLATMYIYKPMVGHNLMQAIARVNRVFLDKEGGLVIDYIGIANKLKEAMNEYSIWDRKNYGDTDINTSIYPQFLEKLEICRDFFHGYNYKEFINNASDRGQMLRGEVNFILERYKHKEEISLFIKEAYNLHQLLSLCVSSVEEDLRIKAAFIEAVRISIVKLLSVGEGTNITLPEINQKISALLQQSIKSEGVINLFSDIHEGVSLFDTYFLEEIAKMKEKNIAIEILKGLIEDQNRTYKRSNIVKSKKFSELLHNIMNKYLHGMLTSEQTIEG